MSQAAIPLWLRWAREIQAIAQTGLHFSANEFDRGRYQRLAEIASEIVSHFTQLPEDTLLKSFLAQPGYATPKVDVRAAVFLDGRILMVQERTDGMWSLPGGWADVNMSPAAMVEREVWEESGFRVSARKVAGVFESNHDRDPINVYHAYKVLFLCDLVGGEARTSNETSAVQYFGRDELPPFSPFRTPERVVQEAFAHLDDPDRPAAFE
jgi:ADP-ribose pyrophosphatase YjhB (NUDIX family)